LIRVILLELVTELLEAIVDFIKPVIDLIEAVIDLAKPFIDLVEAIVNPAKSLVDFVEAIVDPTESLSYRIEAIVNLANIPLAKATGQRQKGHTETHVWFKLVKSFLDHLYSCF
jgi:hypothetical protein